MVVRRPAITFRGLIVVAVLGMLLLGGGIFVGVNVAVEHAVMTDAEQKAQGWTDYFFQTMPGLEDLLITGRLNESQARVVEAAEKLGDVFRFKLFDRNGGVVLVSDEAAYDAEAPATREHSDIALGVLSSGISNISLNDGSGKQNRPPLYVEAYVPMLGPDGSTAGIVEVYIDQTATAALFHGTFAILAIGLAVVAALALSLPTLAYLLRTRQARASKERAEFLAHHDPMTGLLNRGSFNERLEARLDQAGGRDGLAVAFFDIDDFKAINNSYGHQAGDEILRHVSRSIGGSLGDGDLAARAGGDEFAVAFAGKPLVEVIAATERIMQAARQPIAVRGRSISARLSAGIHDVEASGGGLAEVMHKADVALYQAKIDGGNIHRLFSGEIESRKRVRLVLEQLIRDAVQDGTFALHYQPLVHSDTKRCAGFEALLRLSNEQGEFVPPATFIPIAESMGLINDIGKWVIDTATRAAAAWPEELFVSVNLSVRQFNDGNLVGHVERALAASGLKATRLELEVTESMLMENNQAIAAQLADLQALGVSIALDDFGTGYSSLGYLWQFGFDKLKIDRLFISALDLNDNQARDILDTIIMLGHKLDMTVTAEGVETESQAQILSGLACDHFQGYLYGRPAPEADIAAFLLANLAGQAPPARKRRAAKRAA